jgi:CRISPR/Cas system-associated exonuclease Cas4 (RecB family)
MQISKTDFIHYLNCPKSLWFLKYKPDRYPHGEFSDYMKKLTAEGYEVEAFAQKLIKNQPDEASYSFQSIFQTQRGLYAKADVIRDNGEGTNNLYEVKSSTSVKNSGQHNQIKDAAFQKIAAEEAGLEVARVFIVQLNKDYVRQGDVDPEELLIFADVTSDVAEIEADTRAEIDGALELLAQHEIDENSCSCLQLTKSNHGDSFSFFNPAIPSPSIYTLPRISKAKIAGFVADGRFDLDEIGLDEVTDKQAPVLQSAHLKTPMIDQAATRGSLARLRIRSISSTTRPTALPFL